MCHTFVHMVYLSELRNLFEIQIMKKTQFRAFFMSCNLFLTVKATWLNYSSMDCWKRLLLISFHIRLCMFCVCSPCKQHILLHWTEWKTFVIYIIYTYNEIHVYLYYIYKTHWPVTWLHSLDNFPKRLEKKVIFEPQKRHVGLRSYKVLNKKNIETALISF